MTDRSWAPEQAGKGAVGLYPSVREQIPIIAIVVSLFAAIFMFGADRNDLALFFSGLFALLLLLLIANEEWARNALVKRGSQLLVPAILFTVALVFIAWGMTPFGPSGPHPVWNYVTVWPAIAIDRSAVFSSLIKLVGLSSTFLLGWIVSSSDLRARYLLTAVVVATCAYGLWALVQNVSPELRIDAFNSFQNHRLSGSFQSANTAGSLFGAVLLLAICLIFEGSRHAGSERGEVIARITLPIAAAALLGTCLVLTVSRGASTATLCGCAIFLIWEMFARDWRGIERRNVLYGVAIAGVILVLAWSGDLLLGRYADSVKDWVDQRQVIYSVHWEAFLASPWFGYGLGTFDEVNKLLETSSNYFVLWNVRAAHNAYLQWLEEAGIFGSIPMFGCLAWIIARTALGSRNRRRMTTWLRACVAASILILIHSWSDFTLEIPALAMLWSVLLGSGYALAFSRRHKESPAIESSQQPPQGSISRAAPVWVAAALGTVVFLSSALAWWEIEEPFGIELLFLPLSPVYAYRAQSMLASARDKQDVLTAEDLTDQELNLSPARADGWLRLAMIGWIKGQSGPQVSANLDRSYLVGPLDPQIFASRTRFVFDHWNFITQSVREEALAEVRVGWLNWIENATIRRLAAQTRNPAGRLAIRLQISGLSAGSGPAGKAN
jgi:O-antigen ligase